MRKKTGGVASAWDSLVEGRLSEWWLIVNEVVLRSRSENEDHYELRALRKAIIRGGYSAGISCSNRPLLPGISRSVKLLE